MDRRSKKDREDKDFGLPKREEIKSKTNKSKTEKSETKKNIKSSTTKTKSSEKKTSIPSTKSKSGTKKITTISTKSKPKSKKDAISTSKPKPIPKKDTTSSSKPQTSKMSTSKKEDEKKVTKVTNVKRKTALTPKISENSKSRSTKKTPTIKKTPRSLDSLTEFKASKFRADTNTLRPGTSHTRNFLPPGQKKENINNRKKSPIKIILILISILVMIIIGSLLTIKIIKNRNLNKIEETEDENNEINDTLEDTENSTETNTEIEQNEETIESSVQEEPPTVEENETITPGEINIVENKDNSFYTVISSSIDKDLCMDYAKKIVKEGKDVYIIPAKGDQIYNKLALGKHLTLKDAKNTVKDLEERFNKKIWIMKH